MDMLPVTAAKASDVGFVAIGRRAGSEASWARGNRGDAARGRAHALVVHCVCREEVYWV